MSTQTAEWHKEQAEYYLKQAKEMWTAHGKATRATITAHDAFIRWAEVHARLASA